MYSQLLLKKPRAICGFITSRTLQYVEMSIYVCFYQSCLHSLCWLLKSLWQVVLWIVWTKGHMSVACLSQGLWQMLDTLMGQLVVAVPIPMAEWLWVWFWSRAEGETTRRGTRGRWRAQVCLGPLLLHELCNLQAIIYEGGECNFGFSDDKPYSLRNNGEVGVDGVWRLY